MSILDTYHIYKHAWVYSGEINTEKKLSKQEALSLLEHGGWMVRNAYGYECSITDRPTNFWYVIKDQFGGMEELSAKTRNQVRRGLANYNIRKITSEEILNHGYKIYCEAAASYKIALSAPSIFEFQDRIKSTDSSNEFWGAFNAKKEMVAFAINKVKGNSCDYQTMKAIPADMKNYVYYALIYEMNRHYLQERKMQFVIDGARSITEHSNMQPFLESKFNFRKAYCHLKIYYKWWFGIIVKCLYPFRGIIKNNQIHAVLAMHGMQS